MNLAWFGLFNTILTLYVCTQLYGSKYIFTQPFPMNRTHNHFFKWSTTGLNSNFPSLRLVATPSLKS